MDGTARAAFAVCVVADDEDRADVDARVRRWAKGIWGQGHDDVPLSLIHDVGLVVARGMRTRLLAGREHISLDDVLADADRSYVRAIRLRFEDAITAPLLADHSIKHAHIIVAAAHDDSKDSLIVHVLSQLLPRLVDGLSLPVQHMHTARHVTSQEGDVDAALDGDLVLAAAAHLEQLSQRQLPTPALRPEELWELSHLEAVPSEAVRMALRTVHRVVASLPAPHPAVIARLKDRRAQVQLDDENEADEFPAGGFDAMSTRGALENLVRSEVAYVGVGAEHDARAPDLFDVRYVEGELLYYTRDESPLLERRRMLTVLIDDAARMRHKLRELSAQTLVLVEACVLRAHADLQVYLGAQAVYSQLTLGGDAHVVDEEQGLLRTSLDEDIAHQRVALVTPDELPLSRRAIFSTKPPQKSGRQGAWLWIRVGGTSWQLTDGEGSVDVDVASNEGLRAVVDRLMVLA